MGPLTDAQTFAAARLERGALRCALNGIFKDAKRILCVMIVTFCALGLVAALVTPKYVAKSTLLVLLSSDYASRPAIGGEPASPTMPEKDAILKSEVEILSSVSLAKATVARIGLKRIFPRIAEPGLAARLWAQIIEAVRFVEADLKLSPGPRRKPDPMDLAALAFARDLTVTPDKIGNIITISFRHSNPAVAAEAVNVLIESYLVKRAALFADVQAPAMSMEAETLRVKLNAAARAYSEFKARNDISDYNLQRDILLRQQGDLRRDLQQADAEAAEATRKTAVLQRELDQTPQDVVTYGGARSLVRHGRPNVVDALEIDQARARQTLEAAKARREADAAQLVDVDRSIRRLESKAFELERLDRERNLIEQNYQSVVKTLDARRFQEEVSVHKMASVRVIESAEAPVDSGNLRLVILVAGALLSLFAGVAAAALSNLFRTNFISPEKLERDLGLPVLATIPVLARPGESMAACVR